MKKTAQTAWKLARKTSKRNHNPVIPAELLGRQARPRTVH